MVSVSLAEICCFDFHGCDNFEEPVGQGQIIDSDGDVQDAWSLKLKGLMTQSSRSRTLGPAQAMPCDSYHTLLG